MLYSVNNNAKKITIHQDDEDKVCVIAHSHGGNLAVRALDGNDNLVKGLVCLNTPFFNILGRDPEIFRSVIMYLMLAASMIPFGLWLGYGYGWSTVLTLYLGIVIAGAIIYIFFESMYRYIQKKGERFCFKPLKKTPLFCLNTPDDEAFGFLAFLASVQNFLFLLISRTVTYSRLFGAVIAILLIFEVLPFLNVPWDLMNDAGLTTRALLDADNFRFVPGSLTGFLLVCFKLFLIYMISILYYIGVYLVLILVVLICLSIVVTLAQGFFAPLSSLFNRFIVSLKPLGSVNTEFLERQGDATSLRHSSLYNDRKTIRDILDWMDQYR